MTLEIFHELLKDTSRCKNVFDEFIQKNRNIFDTIINIKFSDKRYEAIDIYSIYYNDFMEFVIEQLATENKSISFNHWVTNIAKKRVQYIQPMVNKCLAKVLLEKGGKENWDTLNGMMRTDFIKIINKVLFKYFDNVKYAKYYDDIRNALLAYFYESRIHAPNPIGGINDIEKYLQGMLKNIAVKPQVRKSIDCELGLDHDDIELDKFDRSNDDNFELVGNEMSSGRFEKLEYPDKDDTSIGESFLQEQSSNDEKVWAEKEIEKLLGLFPSPKKDQAEWIRKIKLLGYDYEELAEEEGCSVSYMYTRINRAMVTLCVVALPSVKERCKKMFNENVDDLENQYYRNILNDFFNTDKDWQELASSYQKLPKVFAKDLVDAFNAIKKIHAKKESIYVSDSDIKDYLENEYIADAQKSKRTILNPNKKLRRS